MNKKQINDNLKTIKNILWEDWDPIGINDAVTATDEYDNYAPEVYKMIANGADAITVAKYLTYVDTKLLGSTANPTRDLIVADKLVNEIRSK